MTLEVFTTGGGIQPLRFRFPDFSNTASQAGYPSSLALSDYTDKGDPPVLH